MERRLRFIFANVFKYYFAYKYWSEKYNEIELPSRMNRILAIVAKQFTNFSTAMLALNTKQMNIFLNVLILNLLDQDYYQLF